MKIEKQRKILEKFYNELFYGQEDMPEEYQKILDENFWDLIGDNKKE